MDGKQRETLILTNTYISFLERASCTSQLFLLSKSVCVENIVSDNVLVLLMTRKSCLGKGTQWTHCSCTDRELKLT